MDPMGFIYLLLKQETVQKHQKNTLNLSVDAILKIPGLFPLPFTTSIGVQDVTSIITVDVSRT